MANGFRRFHSPPPSAGFFAPPGAATPGIHAEQPGVRTKRAVDEILTGAGPGPRTDPLPIPRSIAVFRPSHSAASRRMDRRSVPGVDGSATIPAGPATQAPRNGSRSGERRPHGSSPRSSPRARLCRRWPRAILALSEVVAGPPRKLGDIKAPTATVFGWASASRKRWIPPRPGPSWIFAGPKCKLIKRTRAAYGAF